MGSVVTRRENGLQLEYPVNYANKKDQDVEREVRAVSLQCPRVNVTSIKFTSFWNLELSSL